MGDSTVDVVRLKMGYSAFKYRVEALLPLWTFHEREVSILDETFTRRRFTFILCRISALPKKHIASV